MLHYDLLALAALWEQQGGDPAARGIAAGVATAESGGYVAAISPSSDYGLWQINSIHFGSVGINANNWEDPAVNARAAIAISANGSNWAPWCTCWTNPGPNCGHGYLPYPQPGSPAYDPAREADALLLITGAVAGLPANVGGIDSMSSAWRQLQGLLGADARNINTDLSNVGRAIGGMRT